MTTAKKVATTATTNKRKSTTKKKTTSFVVDNLPKNPLAFEVFDLVSRSRTKQKKIEILKKYDDSSLRRLFVWNFDQSIVSILPEGPVPYVGYDEQNTYSGTLTTKISEEVRKMHESGNFSLGASDKQGHTTIRRESKHFYHFVKGGNDGINAIRRETMYINILQGLHPLEAEILVLVKDKQLETKYKISKDIVSEAYPDIVWGDRS
jgi:hypothetical protein|tara:strand:- start:528 stop:1148 length:621 start_codon:yes stop_codon:yes gene_type:complete